MQNQSLTLLKRDERGCVRSMPQMRQAAVAEYQRRGLSQGLTQKRPRVLAESFDEITALSKELTEPTGKLAE